jgi:hypothetical protein
MTCAATGTLSLRWSSVSRRLVPWLLSVPLMLAGTEVAHWVAFRLVYPEAWERSQALQQSGHGYLEWLPACGGIGLALLASAAFLYGRAACSDRTRMQSAPKLSRFAALPPLAFALQEHLESLVHSGSISGVVTAPTFMIGLVLQLPFAVLAYVLARLLSGVSERVGRAFSACGSSSSLRAPVLSVPRCALLLSPPRFAALAGGHAERGPPF